MLKINKSVRTFLMFFIALSTKTISPPFACTEFRLQSKDKKTLITRTMEYGINMNAHLRTFNRDSTISIEDAAGKQNFIKTKYGFVFFDAFNIDIAVDGMNEKGLSFGALYLPGYTQYQNVPYKNKGTSIPYTQIGNWILGNFSTVDEVKTALNKTYIFPQTVPQFKETIFPLHFSVYEPSGRGLVIEYVKGELKLYENQIGILTNSPTYDWHIANIKNYLNLRAMNPEPTNINGLMLEPFGEGFGMIGLPGDYSPPSRFVKIGTLLRFVRQGNNSKELLNYANHIINNVDITFDAVLNNELDPFTGKQATENTQWTGFKDLTEKKIYFHTYENLQLRIIDLNKIDFSKNAPRLDFPISSEQTVVDVTDQFKHHVLNKM